MSRNPRLEFAGATYHIYARGNECRDIFRCDNDRRTFLDLFATTEKKFDWRCMAYCLMSNHYHLLICTLKATLSKGMHHLNSVYTHHFNLNYERTGHLFQGRFKDTLIQNTAQLNAVARYIVLNPVRAGLVVSPEIWPWSSHAAMIGAIKPHACLDVESALSNFGENLSVSRSEYKCFISSLVTGTAVAKFKSLLHHPTDIDLVPH